MVSVDRTVSVASELDRLPVEQFAALAALPSFRHGFVGLVPGVDVRSDKTEALRRLDKVHRQARRSLGMGEGEMPLLTAEQVHGAEIAVIDSPVTADHRYAGCDGLITNQPEIALGIYVADCGAVYLLDPVRRVIALVHSGKKGTELGIAPRAIELMQTRFGSDPKDLVVQVSPCIRPPRYEIDFATEIARQCRELGVLQVHDCGTCTASEPERYYSYRREKGRTGRMLALLAMNSRSTKS